MRRLKCLLAAFLLPMTLVTRNGQVDAFNIDTRIPEVIHGQEGSWFGYSVALWSDKTGHKSVVVGAPRGTLADSANESFPLGNIYMCETTKPEDNEQCSVRVDLPRLNEDDYSLQAAHWAKDIILKQGIGFGETLYTSRKTSTSLLACAPRYPRYNILNTAEQLQTRGACYLLDEKSRSATDLKVLPYPYVHTFYGTKNEIRDWNDHMFTGFSEAGFSVLLNQGENFIYLGGPYGFNGQGSVIRSLSSDGKRKSVSRDRMGEKKLDGNMEGWAMVSGKFDGQTELIATSLPGSNDCKGSIRIYKPNLKTFIAERSGRELGSKYGFSLTAGDFNGDKIDDLAVGAPLSAIRGRLQDVGRVFVYYSPAKQGNSVTPSSALELEGKEPWGRFGQAITCPGDLDLDGFDDLVIGAPGTLEGRGTVFIFNGGKEGLRQQPSQEIIASKFPFGLSWFGFSLDGGLDVDENGYPDITVGAPDSDTAIILRSGPVVSLKGGIDFESPEISLGSLSCQVLLQNGQKQNVDCFTLVINLQYSAKHMDHPLPFRFDVKVDPYRQRVAFLDNHDFRYSLIHNVTHNETEPTPLVLKIYVKPNVRRLNLNDPVEGFLDVALLSSDGPEYPQSDNTNEEEHSPHSAEVFSVLSAYSETSFFTHTRFSCDDAATCVSQPDLVLTAEKAESVLVGKGSAEVKVNLEVRNNTAFSLVLEMQAPSILTLLRAQSDDYLPECVLKHDDGHDKVFICRFISEIPKDVKIRLSFAFKYDPLPLLEHPGKHLRFKFNASSDTLDLQPSDNFLEVLVPKVSRVDLRAEGIPDPDTMEGRLNKSVLWQVIGQRLTHRFELTNHGPSPLLKSKIIIGLPLQLVSGYPALNLIDLKTSSNVKCVLPSFNPLNLTIDEEDDGNSTNTLNEDEVATEEMDEVSDALREGNNSSVILLSDSPADYDDHAENRNKRRKRRILYKPSQNEDVTTASTLTESSSEDPTTPLPRPLTSDIPDTSKDRPTGDSGRIETLTVNCSNTECEEIECEVSTLLVEEYASVEVISYIVAGYFRLRYFKSLVIETGMTVLASQENVFLNGRVVVEKAENFSQDLTDSENHTSDPDVEYITSNYTDGTNRSMANLNSSMTSVNEEWFTTENGKSSSEADLEDNQTTSSDRNTDFSSGSEENETTLIYDDENSTMLSYRNWTTFEIGNRTELVTKSVDLTQSSTAATTKDMDANSTRASSESMIDSSSTEEYEELRNVITKEKEELRNFVTEEHEGLSYLTTESNNLTLIASTGKVLLWGNASSDSADDINSTGDIVSTFTTEDVPSHIHGSNNVSLSTSADLAQSHKLSKDPGDFDATEENSGVKGGNVTTTTKTSKKRYPVIASTYVFLIRKHEERKINVESLLEIGMWKLILAVVGGLMLIIILCAILYKIGFFKRNRISAEEREELQQQLKKNAEKEKYY